MPFRWDAARKRRTEQQQVDNQPQHNPVRAEKSGFIKVLETVLQPRLEPKVLDTTSKTITAAGGGGSTAPHKALALARVDLKERVPDLSAAVGAACWDQ